MEHYWTKWKLEIWYIGTKLYPLQQKHRKLLKQIIKLQSVTAVLEYFLNYLKKKNNLF